MFLFITPRRAIDRSGFHPMFPLPTELTRRYESLLTQQAMPCHHRPHYLRWLRYYWDFCHWHQLEPTDCSSLAAFEEKLRAEQKPDFQRQQAHRAVSLYYQNLSAAPRPQNQAPVEVHPNHCSEGRSVTNRSVVQRTTATAVCSSITSVKCPSQNQDSAARPIHWQIASQANHATTHAVAQCGGRDHKKKWILRRWGSVGYPSMTG